MRLKATLPQLPSVRFRQSQPLNLKQSKSSQLKKIKKSIILSQMNNPVDTETSKNPDNSFEKYYDAKLGIFKKNHLGLISVPKPTVMLRECYTLIKTDKEPLAKLLFPEVCPQIIAIKEFKLETESPQKRLRNTMRTLRRTRATRIQREPTDVAVLKEFISTCKEGDLVKVEMMLDNDPSVLNARDLLGMTPLHWAALRGYTAITKLLIKANALVDALDCVIFIQRNRTPLHIATRNGHLEIVEKLIRHGANPCLFTDSKKMPLHLTSDIKILNAIKVGMKVIFS